jgi:predicted TIM-barrel fold metal-dependent hydrolase
VRHGALARRPRGPPAASAREHGVATLARLYYDLAGTPIPHSLRGLLGIAQVEHLLYASDTSFTPANLIERAARALVETDVLDEEQKAGLFSDNAAALFPRFAQAPTSSAH